MARRAPGRTQTSHRPSRDGQKAAELTDLKRENYQLRRRVARLLKQIEHLELLTPDVEPEPMAVDVVDVPVEKARCPGCDTSTGYFEMTILGGKTISGCRSCKWRPAA